MPPLNTFATLAWAPARISPAGPLAAPGDGSSGAPPWLTIVVGALIGIGIGLLIVFRAKRKHPAPGSRDKGKKDGRE